jgi:hypothetical protein
MLTHPELDQLNALAHDLADRAFGGDGKVEGLNDDFVRLTLVKRVDGGAGHYSLRVISASSYAAAAQEILRAVHAAAATNQD